MGIGIMIDATITIGNIIEISVLALGGLAGMITVKNSVSNLKSDVIDMKVEIKELSSVVSKMALTDLRLSNVEQDIRELKHGRGFVREAIEGEYPPR